MTCTKEHKEKWCHHLGKGDYCTKYQNGNCEKNKGIGQILYLSDNLNLKIGEIIFSAENSKMGKIIYKEDDIYIITSNKFFNVGEFVMDKNNLFVSQILKVFEPYSYAQVFRNYSNFDKIRYEDILGTYVLGELEG